MRFLIYHCVDCFKCGGNDFFVRIILIVTKKTIYGVFPPYAVFSVKDNDVILYFRIRIVVS